MCPEKKIRTVLVVEDQMEMRIFLRTLLETHGFRPVLAIDGRRGLACARELHPDIIILDVMMPNEGGAIMYRNLKGDAELCQVPVIMLSAVAPRAFRHYLYMLNSQSDQPLPLPDAYIEKPPSPQQVLQALDECHQK
jgi:CheY-like chemotaxis protein